MGRTAVGVVYWEGAEGTWGPQESVGAFGIGCEENGMTLISTHEKKKSIVKYCQRWLWRHKKKRGKQDATRLNDHRGDDNNKKRP